jgi:hypothetical protein
MAKRYIQRLVRDALARLAEAAAPARGPFGRMRAYNQSDRPGSGRRKIVG